MPIHVQTYSKTRPLVVFNDENCGKRLVEHIADGTTLFYSLSGFQLQDVAGNIGREPLPLCAICLTKTSTSASLGNNNNFMLMCSHPFHPRCLLTWAGREMRCPTCRAAFTYDDVSACRWKTELPDPYENSSKY